VSFRARATLALLADENDALAKRIDPSGFCYAVLQILRNGEAYSEADFQALVERGAQEDEARATALEPARQRRRDLLEEREAPVRLPPRRRPPRINGQVRYAGSDDEAERIAEAERTGGWEGQEDVYGDDRDEPEAREGYERVRYEAEPRDRDRDRDREERPVRRTPKQRSPDEVVLTRAQLAGLLEQATLRAVEKMSQAPTTPQPEVEVDDEPEDEEADEVFDIKVDPDEEPPTPQDVEAADADDAADAADRGRDASGRFAPSAPSSSKRSNR
jgi:hypothetical protein